MKLSLFPFLFFLLALLFYAPAQEEDQDPRIQLTPQLDMMLRVPQSPEAAAFVKYGNIPVQMYTGTPDISVPLFTLQGRELSLPLSLNYDASGIKVDQIATWVGLGWSLNAGGAVTRQVQGLPDGYGDKGSIFDPEIQDFIEYASRHNLATGTFHLEPRYRKYFELTEGLAYGQVDLQPDLFPFRINGLSGTLFINYQEKKAYCMEHPNLKVEVGLFLADSNPVSQLRSWKITDVDGTQYIFEKQEFTNHRGEAGPHYGGFFRRYVSAWYISKIISPNERDVVEFTYSAVSPWVNKQDISHTYSGVSVVNRESNSSICGGNSEAPQYLSGSGEANFWAEQAYLESIHINGYQRAVFYKSSQDRLDLNGMKRLTSLNFYDPLGRAIVSHIKLNNGQPDGKDPGFYFGKPNSLLEKEQRLMLKGVSFYGDRPNAEKALQQFKFEYFDPEKVPPRGSYAADMAGYYNGQDQNSSLIPQYVENGVNFFPKGARRKPDLAACRVGTLKKIIYPTGGETDFAYDLHRIPDQNDPTVLQVTRSLLALRGGVDRGRNPYGFEYGCFEEEPTTDPIPRGGANAFSYNLNNQTFEAQKIHISVEGRSTSDDFMYLVVYKSGECPRAEPGECPSTRYSFCEVYNWVVSCREEADCPIDIIFSGDPRYMHPRDREILMENISPGGYQILGFNGDAQATLKVELLGMEKQEISNREVEGGLRVVEKIDKVDRTTPATHTYYLYQDFSQSEVEFSPELAINAEYTSSGKRLFNPAYTRKQLATFCEGIDFPNGITCERTSIFSQRLYPANGHVGYSAVTEIQYAPGVGINGFTVNRFHNESASLNKIPGIQGLNSRLNGRPKDTRIFHKDRRLLSSQSQTYKIESLPHQRSSLGLTMESSHIITGLRMLSRAPEATRERGYTLLSYGTFCKAGNGRDALPPECTEAIACLFGSYPLDQQLTHYAYSSFWLRNTQNLQSQYVEEGGEVREVFSQTDYFYENPLHKQLTRSVFSGKDGTTQETRMYYPDDDLASLTYMGPTEIQGLYSDVEISTIKRLGHAGKYQLNEVVASEQWYNGKIRIFVEKKAYQNFGNRVLPISIANSNGQGEPKTVASLSYLNNGLRLSEVRRPTGPPQLMLYAYDYTLPVMSLVGVPLGGRSENGLQNRYASLVSLGELTNSTQIARELAKIRELSPDALSIDYTYNLKLQLVKTKSPDGVESFFSYDDLGRLIQTRNDDEQLVQAIEYHQIQPK